MSLINDALKRASSPPKSRASAPLAPTLAPFQPVPDSNRGSGPLPIVLCIVGVGALLMAGAFWLKAKGTTPATQVASVQTQPHALNTTPPTLPTVTTPTTAVSATQPVPQNPVQQATATLEKVVARNESPDVVSPRAPSATAIVSAPVADIPLEVAPAEMKAVDTTSATEPVVTEAKGAAPAPTFRLQAIYYRMRGPTVVINGKTVGIGDAIDGARLVGIERTSAEIAFRGKIQKLTMR